MNWTETLKSQVEENCASTARLLAFAEDDALDWKPPAGENWMTLGQLLEHVATACGAPCKGFVTGDWGMPDGVSMEDIPPEEMLPTADKMPAVATVAKAREKLAADRQLALDMIDRAGEEALATKTVTAPWDPRPQLLGYMLLEMVLHLVSHKMQLFFYLKSLGKPVNTGHLWGAE